MHRRLALEDPAAVGRRGFLVLLDDIDALDGDPAARRVDGQHHATPPAVLARDHLYGIAPADARGHHSTSGASDTIFMNFLARSSRATGPKMRVPIGSELASSSTTELSSKRMYEPSGRAISLRVRTITALCTCFFFTRLFGSASLTDTLMMSPTVA